MSEYLKPCTEEEFEENFAQKKPLMNHTESYYESSRCLFCYDAPCMNACPTEIDIPLFIKQIHTGNVSGAAKTIYASNWLGNACAKVCPTGELCEGACVYNHQNVKPVEIGRLQNVATKSVIDSKKPLFKAGASNGKKIAIIGAGPAGIACACELRLMGYEVDVFESKEKPSGLTVHGIAPYKIENQEVLDEIDYLKQQLGWKISYNNAIDTPAQIKSLENQYQAIFLGVGIGATADLNIPGEDTKGVIGAVEFIEQLRMQHHNTPVGKNVVVIGGGNTAMDAASETARMGAETVHLVYRRGKKEMGAYGFEYQTAIGAGVRGIFNASPLEIKGNDKVRGVKFIKTKINDGRLQKIEGTEFEIPCDMVIKATGQAKQKHLFDLIDNLQRDASNKLLVNPNTFQCSNPKYFAGGDAVNGGAEVVNAASEGKKAALGIDAYLKIQL